MTLVLEEFLLKVTLVSNLVPLEVTFVFEVLVFVKAFIQEDPLVVFQKRMLVVTFVLVKDIVGVMINLVRSSLRLSSSTTLQTSLEDRHPA